MTSITSVQMNYLVFRYLQESGLTHSAFALGYEAGINKCTIDGNMVPPSALITLVQKGLQYLEMEANLSNNETDGEEDFSFLEPLDLITKDVFELQKIIREKKKNLQKDRDKDKDKDLDREPEAERVRAEAERGRAEAERGRAREKDRMEREKEHEKDRERKEKDKEQQKQREDPKEKEIVTDAEGRDNTKHEENGASAGK